MDLQFKNKLGVMINVLELHLLMFALLLIVNMGKNLIWDGIV
jgi:hypothetical protein